jgi:hypothetical protein
MKASRVKKAAKKEVIVVARSALTWDENERHSAINIKAVARNIVVKQAHS